MVKFGMKSMAVGALFLLGVDAKKLPPAAIAGGAPVPINSYPFIVALTDSQGVFCGGSIIANQWVLTAAHCIEDVQKFIRTTKVVGGTANLRNSPQGQVRAVESVVQHPGWGKGVQKQDLHDIAVIKLKQPFQFGPNVQPALLEYVDLPANIRTQAIGWGSTSEYGDAVNELRAVQLSTGSAQNCDRAYDIPRTSAKKEGFICA